MSASPILTQGLGSFGAATLLPTLGFGVAQGELLHTGSQYSADDSRLRWAADDERAQWEAADERAQWAAEDYRPHYWADDNRGHWSR